MRPHKSISNHKECARDKLDDRTATCPQGKVLKLERWLRSYMETRQPIVTMGFFIWTDLRARILLLFMACRRKPGKGVLQ